MLNPSKGISAFVDNLIVISAARYGASVSEALAGEQQHKWNLVALAVQSVLLHPHSDDERLMLRHIDVSQFTAEVCHHRGAYLLWKAKRAAEADNANRPSTFNITRDSLANEIGLLYKSVKDNLPTIAPDVDDSSIEEVHQFVCKSEEDVRRDQKLAEAEDELMRGVQELQSEFFAKHKKWVEVPISLSPSKSTAVAARSASSKPRLEDLDTAGVAQLLDDLDLGEHKQLFRRTTGKLLAEILKGDLRERFGGDKEAADILWAHIEKNRSAKSAAPQASSAATTPSRDATKSAEQLQAERIFAAFRSPDPFASLKKAMNPERPLRPSEQFSEHFNAEMDDAEARAMEDRYAKATAGSPPPASSQKIGNKPAAAAPKATETAPARANRWQVVEYDDDDDEDEDDS